MSTYIRNSLGPWECINIQRTSKISLLGNKNKFLITENKRFPWYLSMPFSKFTIIRKKILSLCAILSVRKWLRVQSCNNLGMQAAGKNYPILATNANFKHWGFFIPYGFWPLNLVWDVIFTSKIYSNNIMLSFFFTLLEEPKAEHTNETWCFVIEFRYLSLLTKITIYKLLIPI